MNPTNRSEDKKFSLEKCKRILNRNGKNYPDEEVKKIRDFLYFLAELEYETFKKNEVHEMPINQQNERSYN